MTFFIGTYPAAVSASGSGWSVAMCGDTFGGTWTVTNSLTSPLIRLSFDGSPGRTVFDRAFSPFPGTPGSADGRDFAWVSGSGGLASLDVIYTDILGVPPAAPVGDLYTVVNIQINGNNGLAGTTAPAVFQFSMDTDNASSDVVRVPEPASLALLSLGLLAAGVARRRRTKA